MHEKKSVQVMYAVAWVAALPSLLVAAAFAFAATVPTRDTASLESRVQSQLAALAVSFEENRGQFDPEVAFAAKSFAGTVFVTVDGTIVHSLLGPAENEKAVQPLAKRQPHDFKRRSGWVLMETPQGGLPLRPAVGRSSNTRISHLSARHDRVATDSFGTVELGLAWPGIGLTLAARGANVEKIFTLAPGAEVDQIRMKVRGAQLALGTDGALIANTGRGPVKFTPPIAWQWRENGERAPIEVAYRLEEGATYGFTLGRHDTSLPVVIDPLMQATFVGGAGTDDIRAVAVDSATGNVYVAGYTQSASFPKASATSGIPATFNNGAGDNGSVDAFIAKLNPTLTNLIQMTYLGGSGSDVATSLKIDAAGSVYVGGYTYSSDFPVTAGAAQMTKAGDSTTPDAFVAKLNGALTSLSASTYLGGTDIDAVNALAVADTGIVVAGQTGSTDFPTASPVQAAKGGGKDAFLALLNKTTLGMVRATYLGGNDDDEAFGLAVDSSTTPNTVYAAGYTYSTNFPAGTINPNTLFPSKGNGDAFVAKFNASLQTREATTYLGGAGEDAALAIAFDNINANKSVVVVGYTQSSDFPKSAGNPGPQTALGGGTDAFVARLSPALDSLYRATYLGGGSIDIATAVMIHPSGEIYVAGYTDSDASPGPVFPATKPATGGAAVGTQADSAGSTDVFVSRLDANASALIQSTYLGGNGADVAYGLALSASPAMPGNDIIVAGFSASGDFFGTAGGAQAVAGGEGDGFVAVLSRDLKVGISDPKPNSSFSFAAQINAAPNTLLTSSPAKISGLSGAAPIAVDGGEYCISSTNSCSCNVQPWGSAAGTVDNNQYVCVRQVTAQTAFTTTKTSVTIFGTHAAFVSTTAPAVADTSPAAFDFGAAANVATGALVNSGSVQMTGINLPAAISISSLNNDQYCISSAGVPAGSPCLCDVVGFTNTAGTIGNGQFVCVRHAAAQTNATTVTTTLTVGGVQGPFQSTTQPAGALTDPQPFAFVAQTDVAPQSVAQSAPIHILGINAPSPVAVAGGQYCVSSTNSCSCDISAYTTLPGTVINDQYICVQQSTQGSGGSSASTILSVGNASATFTSKTYGGAETVLVLTGTPPNGTVGVPYAFNMTVSGLPKPTFSISAGALPSGLTLHKSTGMISGTPTVAGTTSNIIIRADNGVSVPTNTTIGITVSGAATAPDAPTIGLATAGNEQVSVAFVASAADGGSPITGFTATCGAKSNTGTSSPIVVTGLANGTAVTCTVKATNAVASSVASGASNSVTPAAPSGAPDKPGIGAATAGNGQATIAFTPGGDGGSPITGFKATCGSQSNTGQASPITVGGLTNGVAVTCSVVAINANGSSAASDLSNSITPATVPGAPVIGVPIAGNGQVSVAFASPAGNGGAPITGFTATCGAKSNSGQTSPIIVTGLANAVAVTCVVTATNAVGNGPASNASSAVTPATVPDAPTIGLATAGSGEASIAFVAPASNGGSPITGFTANCGGQTGSGTSSPIVVTGLANGTAVSCTVVASNAIGTSVASGASNAVTPTAIPTAPNPFTFGATTSVALGATVTSSPVQITGLAGAVAISVTGGAYCISANNTGNACTCSVQGFASTPGTVANGQFVCVRHVSANTYSAQTTTTLNIGTGAGSFTSTTIPPPLSTTPLPFVLAPANPNVQVTARNAVVMSSPARIVGINAPADISVLDGEFCISSHAEGGNCYCDIRPFAATTAVVMDGQFVCVRQTASNQPRTTTRTLLTVGGLVTEFSSTTAADLARRGIDLDGMGRSALLLRTAGGAMLAGRYINGRFDFVAYPDLNPIHRVLGVPDIDGDGRSDLVYLDTSQGLLGDVWLQPDFDAPAQKKLRSVKATWDVQAVGDMDGDGFGDLVWRYVASGSADTGVSYIWFTNGEGVAQVRKRGGAPLDWKLVGAADLNADGAADLIYVSPTNQVRVLMATANRTCANLAAGETPKGFKPVHVANFGGVGQADILLHDETSGQVNLLSLSAGGVALPAPVANPDDPNASCTPTNLTVRSQTVALPDVAEGWRFYASGDFDGNGLFDIVWKRPDGTLTLWLMKPSGVPQVIDNAGVAPAAYAVIAP